MEQLKINETIHLHGLKYIVHDSCFLYGSECSNDEIFIKLRIVDKYEFIEKIVGYKPYNGYFPLLRSLEDLTKVVEALIEYNNPKHEKAEVYTNF